MKNMPSLFFNEILYGNQKTCEFSWTVWLTNGLLVPSFYGINQILGVECSAG